MVGNHDVVVLRRVQPVLNLLYCINIAIHDAHLTSYIERCKSSMSSRANEGWGIRVSAVGPNMDKSERLAMLKQNLETC
jgi:hypothetical protein